MYRFAKYFLLVEREQDLARYVVFEFDWRGRRAPIINHCLVFCGESFIQFITCCNLRLIHEAPHLIFNGTIKTWRKPSYVVGLCIWWLCCDGCRCCQHRYDRWLDARPHHVIWGAELPKQHAFECVGLRLAAARRGSGEFSLLGSERAGQNGGHGFERFRGKWGVREAARRGGVINAQTASKA